MARISQQTKDVLTVVVTIGVGVATGFYIDARSKGEAVLWSLLCLIAFSLAQLSLALVPSKDMLDLEKFRDEQLTRLDLLNEATKQAHAGSAIR